MKHYLGIDLGGTNIKAGVLDEDLNLVALATCKTLPHRPAEQVMDDMSSCAAAALSQLGLGFSDVPQVGVGCPGTVNCDTGVVEYSNNLGWYNVPMRSYLATRMGIPVALDNDANAAAWAEYKAGVAKGCESSVAITIGTGIGSGIILHGQLYRGCNFAGAELGHMVLRTEGRPCTCGRLGCLEAYTSATGLIRMTKEAMEANRDSLLWQTAGGTLENVSGITAFDAANTGDRTARQVVERYLRYLSEGICNIVNIFQPDVLSIAGGVSRQGDRLLLPIQSYVAGKNFARGRGKQTKICIARLGNDAGVIGAALLE